MISEPSPGVEQPSERIAGVRSRILVLGLTQEFRARTDGERFSSELEQCLCLGTVSVSDREVLGVYRATNSHPLTSGLSREGIEGRRERDMSARLRVW